MQFLSEDMVAHLSRLVANYITTQRDRYMTSALPLSSGQKTAMAGYFTQELLERTRVLVLHQERVANPDFYPMLRSMGFDDLPDQSTMAAISFDNCIVSHGPCGDFLLFHELVHVEPYRPLGVSRFADLYLGGFLRAGYLEIPLERNAYSLGEQYVNSRVTFSVAKEVGRWIEMAGSNPVIATGIPDVQTSGNLTVIGGTPDHRDASTCFGGIRCPSKSRPVQGSSGWPAETCRRVCGGRRTYADRILPAIRAVYR
jgi:hypothetical protein